MQSESLLQVIRKDIYYETKTNIAICIAIFVWCTLLVLIAGSYPPKKILMVLMLMFTAFNALSAFAPGYLTMFAARLLAGLPHGAFFGVGSVVASKIADKGKEAQSVSLMFAGLTIANVIGVPLGTYIGHHYSWRYTFIIIVIVGIVTVLSIKSWMPALPATKNRNVTQELAFFRQPESWIIILMIAIGTGGLFSWYSYIAPLLTEVSGFTPDSITYILVIAGLGMLVGNFIGGKLADRFSPVNATISLLVAMCVSLLIVHFISTSQVLSLIMTFVTGAIAFAAASPIQMLMINTAKGSEMLAASVSQASFNIGNALGAFLGGLPLLAGYDYTSPVMVGSIMALLGASFAWMLILRTKKIKKLAFN
ncbi:MAG: MFS transporter [Pedobacter sp.]|nr:MAG: MFS transporter [Pedobacter sp.]